MFRKTVRKLRVLGKVKRQAYLKGRQDQKIEDEKAFANNVGYLRETFSQEASTIKIAEQEMSTSAKSRIKALKENHTAEIKFQHEKAMGDIAELKRLHAIEIQTLKQNHTESCDKLKSDYADDLKKHTDRSLERDTLREQEHKKLKDELVTSRKELDKQAAAWQEENRYLKDISGTFSGAMHKVAQHAEEISKSSARIVGPDRDMFNRIHDILAANEVRVQQIGPALNSNRRPDLP